MLNVVLSSDFKNKFTLSKDLYMTVFLDTTVLGSNVIGFTIFIIRKTPEGPKGWVGCMIYRKTHGYFENRV